MFSLGPWTVLAGAERFPFCLLDCWLPSLGFPAVSQRALGLKVVLQEYLSLLSFVKFTIGIPSLGGPEPRQRAVEPSGAVPKAQPRSSLQLLNQGTPRTSCGVSHLPNPAFHYCCLRKIWSPFSS